MLKTYNGSLSQALIETYKEIKWDIKKFSQVSIYLLNILYNI